MHRRIAVESAADFCRQNERVQVRRANSNDWIPGVVVSALQYFGVVSTCSPFRLPELSRRCAICYCLRRALVQDFQATYAGNATSHVTQVP